MGKLHLEQTQTTELQTQLLPQVSRRQALIAQRDAIIEEINGLSDTIGTALAVADTKTVRVGQFQVTLVENQGRLTLDKHRLVELGVSADTIIAASVRGQPSVSLQVKRVGEGVG